MFIKLQVTCQLWTEPQEEYTYTLIMVKNNSPVMNSLKNIFSLKSLLPGKRQKRKNRKNALNKKTIEDIKVRNALREIISFENDFVLPIGKNIESEKRSKNKPENTCNSSPYSTETDSGSSSRLSSPDVERSQTYDNPDNDCNDKDEGIEVDIDTEYSAEGMLVPDLKLSELILLTSVTALSGHRADCQEAVTVNGVCYACIEIVGCK
jgi:hypothetical protein